MCKDSLTPNPDVAPMFCVLCSGVARLRALAGAHPGAALVGLPNRLLPQGRGKRRMSGFEESEATTPYAPAMINRTPPPPPSIEEHTINSRKLEHGLRMIRAGTPFVYFGASG